MNPKIDGPFCVVIYMKAMADAFLFVDKLTKRPTDKLTDGQVVWQLYLKSWEQQNKLAYMRNRWDTDSYSTLNKVQQRNELWPVAQIAPATLPKLYIVCRTYFVLHIFWEG